jgi:hypothetical protein
MSMAVLVPYIGILSFAERWETHRWLTPRGSDLAVWPKGTFLWERPSGEDRNERLRLGNMTD